MNIWMIISNFCKIIIEKCWKITEWNKTKSYVQVDLIDVSLGVRIVFIGIVTAVRTALKSHTRNDGDGGDELSGRHLEIYF